MSFSPFLDATQLISNIKKTQVLLPIARRTAVVSPLTVGDDLALRTSLLSPAGYDKELSKLLHIHTEFVDDTDDAGDVKPYALNYDEFIKNLSNIDKLSLMWGLYKASYETIEDGKEITCECKNKFKIDILADELIHEDTYEIWEMEDADGTIVPFTSYRLDIPITFGAYTYVFKSKLVTMYDNNKLLNILSNEVIQHNLEVTGSVFTKAQRMAVLIDSITVRSSDPQFQEVSTTNINEILIALQSHIPNSISDEFFKTYGETFNKYVPTYYKTSTCPNCGKLNKTEVDLELDFFRRSVLNRE